LLKSFRKAIFARSFPFLVSQQPKNVHSIAGDRAMLICPQPLHRNPTAGMADAAVAGLEIRCLPAKLLENLALFVGALFGRL
jgi:hypothetical protein